jgi:tetratricopeptide (TPR) repeat protein
MTQEGTSLLLKSAGHPSIAELRIISTDADDQRLLSRWLGPPFQVIGDLPTFVGRNKEVRKLTNVLLSGNHAMLYSLEGMGGVGKSVLAIHVAHLLKDSFPDGVLYARLDVSDTMSILNSFAIDYGLDVKNLTDVESRAAVVRDLLKDKEALIILDNASNSTQIRPLLPSTGKCAVIITTRDKGLSTTRGKRAQKIAVKPFDEEQRESMALFTEYLGTEKVQANDNESKLMEIADLLGHLPLAVDIAASHMADEEGWPIAEFLDLVREELNRLDLEYEDRSVRATFNVSYTLLSIEEEQFFTALGVFDGFDFDGEAVAHVTALQPMEAKKKLARHTRFSLVQFDAQTKRYRLHPLLHDYARERITDDGVFERMSEYYLTVLEVAEQLLEEGGEASKRGLRLFDLERDNMVAGQTWATAQTKTNDSAAALCSSYADKGSQILDVRQHPQERLLWLSAAKAAAQNLGEHEQLMRHLGNLGVTYEKLGEHQRAIELHEQCIEISQKISAHAVSEAERRRARRSEGNALGNLGISYAMLGEFHHAIDSFEKWRDIAHNIDDLRGKANAIMNIGIAYYMIGKPDGSVTHYEQALAIFDNIGDHLGLGKALCNLGNAYLALGHTHRALDFLERSLKISIDLGDRHLKGETLQIMGLVV